MAKIGGIHYSGIDTMRWKILALSFFVIRRTVGTRLSVMRNSSAVANFPGNGK